MDIARETLISDTAHGIWAELHPNDLHVVKLPHLADLAVPCAWVGGHVQDALPS